MKRNFKQIWILFYNMKFQLVCFIFLTVSVQGQNIPATTASYEIIPLNSDFMENANSSLYQVDKKPDCSLDEIFDSDLHICRENCQGYLTFSSITLKCVDSETLKMINRIGRCKNMTIDAPYFTIDEDSQNLKVKSPVKTTVFLPKEYTLHDGRASVCFPYNPAFISCPKIRIEPYEYDLKDDGLTLSQEMSQITYDTGDFVIDENSKAAGICIEESWLTEDSEKGDVVTIVHVIVFSISTVFISLSLIIYAMVYKTLRYHTKIVISHMVSLLVFYIARICFKLRLGTYYPEVCYTYSLITHYFFLASFFWLNVMAYDVWKHLPRFTPKQFQVNMTERKRFLIKSLYCWGSSSVIVISAHLVDNFGPPDTKFKPHFARNCWFATVLSKAVFMFIPVAAILAANSVFFILTVVGLQTVGKSATLVNKKIHRQLSWMYFKLMIVMGICWIAEIISTFVGINSQYWLMTDVINGLQGFFLFIIYICTRTVLHDIVTFWNKHIEALSCFKPDKCLAYPSKEGSSRYNVSKEKSATESELPEYGNGVAGMKIAHISTAYV